MKENWNNVGISADGNGNYLINRNNYVCVKWEMYKLIDISVHVCTSYIVIHQILSLQHI